MDASATWDIYGTQVFLRVTAGETGSTDISEIWLTWFHNGSGFISAKHRDGRIVMRSWGPILLARGVGLAGGWSSSGYISSLRAFWNTDDSGNAMALRIDGSAFVVNWNSDGSGLTTSVRPDIFLRRTL